MEVGRGCCLLKKEGPLKSIHESHSSDQLHGEIIQLREEVNDLRADVKEMIRLMNALYDFESS